VLHVRVRVGTLPTHGRLEVGEGVCEGWARGEATVGSGRGAKSEERSDE